MKRTINDTTVPVQIISMTLFFNHIFVFTFSLQLMWFSQYDSDIEDQDVDKLTSILTIWSQFPGVFYQ